MRLEEVNRHEQSQHGYRSMELSNQTELERMGACESGQKWWHGDRSYTVHFVGPLHRDQKATPNLSGAIYQALVFLAIIIFIVNNTRIRGIMSAQAQV